MSAESRPRSGDPIVEQQVYSRMIEGYCPAQLPVNKPAQLWLSSVVNSMVAEENQWLFRTADDQNEHQQVHHTDGDRHLRESISLFSFPAQGLVTPADRYPFLELNGVNVWDDVTVIARTEEVIYGADSVANRSWHLNLWLTNAAGQERIIRHRVSHGPDGSTDEVIELDQPGVGEDETIIQTAHGAQPSTPTALTPHRSSDLARIIATGVMRNSNARL